jgi:hypothetical protein
MPLPLFDQTFLDLLNPRLQRLEYLAIIDGQKTLYYTLAIALKRAKIA